MSRFTVFIGGVHGAGKGVLCDRIKRDIICDYVSASQLLGWRTKNKQVDDVETNQKLLSILLPNAISADKVFLVDGHFSLWNKDGHAEVVSNSVFESFSPDALIVVVDDENIIAERLYTRDGIKYNSAQIQLLQDCEVSNARNVSCNLSIPLFVVNSRNEEMVISVIHEMKNMMTRYTRDNIYSEMLKTVIMRFDFSGATSIRRFVDNIKQDLLLRNSFKRLRYIPQDQYNVKITKRENDGSLPITEEQPKMIYRFFDCRIDENPDVILDVTSDAICLSIDCRNSYNGSKKYTSFMVSLMTMLMQHDPYIIIERIGIRKIDAQVIPSGENIHLYFNENFVAASSWYSSLKESVNLAELFKIGKVNFNVVQHIDRIPSGEDRAIYDVDAFIENGEISEMVANEKKLSIFLDKDIQDKMFELFVGVAASEYLEKCYKAKQARNQE